MAKIEYEVDCKEVRQRRGYVEVRGCGPIRQRTATTFSEGLDPSQRGGCKTCMSKPTTATERTKGDVWQEIVDGAKTMTKGATPEQKVSIFLSTPKGAELYRDYCDAPDKTVKATEPREVEIGGTAERAVNSLIVKKAAEYRASDSSLTEAQAYVKVLTDHPEVYDRYLRAQQIDRMKRD